MLRPLPVVDFSQLRLTNGRGRIVSQVKTALQTTGAFELGGTSFAADRAERSFELARRFFNLASKDFLQPDREARTFQQGYTPLCGEGEKDRRWLRESFTFRPYLLGGKKQDHESDGKERDLWPDESEIPEFHESCIALGKGLRSVRDDVLEILSEAVGLPREKLKEDHDGQLDVIGLNHYPNMTVAPGEYLCSAHKSIDTFTMLWADLPGLQVADMSTTVHKQSRKVECDANFLDAHCKPGNFVVVLGSKLRKLSGQETPCAVHRVIPPANADTWSRVSLALHVWPSEHVMIDSKTSGESLRGARTNGNIYCRSCDGDKESVH